MRGPSTVEGLGGEKRVPLETRLELGGKEGEALERVVGRLGVVVVSSSALFPSHNMRMGTKRLHKNVF